MSKDKVEVNLQTAEDAFKNFFSPNSLAQEVKEANGNNKEVNGNPVVANAPKQLTTVNTNASNSKEAMSTMSVDDAEAVLNQEKSFKEVLTECEVKMSELFGVIDAFLNTGYYLEKFSIGNKLQFILRSKKMHSVTTITDSVDGARYAMPQAASHLLLKRDMAASLAELKMGDIVYKFEHENQEDDNKVYEFINTKITVPIFSIIAKKLTRFNILLALATRDEALDAFLAQPTD